jgi:hypothetical protein
MPKDVTKNVDRYKIRGGDINEFEYEQNQEAFAEQKNKAATNLILGTPPEAMAIKTTIKKAATKRATKATKATKKAALPARGASAKKLAARKAAKKK